MTIDSFTEDAFREHLKRLRKEHALGGRFPRRLHDPKQGRRVSLAVVLRRVNRPPPTSKFRRDVRSFAQPALEPERAVRYPMLVDYAHTRSSRGSEAGLLGSRRGDSGRANSASIR